MTDFMFSMSEAERQSHADILEVQSSKVSTHQDKVEFFLSSMASSLVRIVFILLERGNQK